MAEERADGSPVRCWPHHFDIATLLTIAPGQTIGVGLEPGDGYYDEPYWYVNQYPAPSATPGNQLEGGGVLALTRVDWRRAAGIAAVG